MALLHPILGLLFVLSLCWIGLQGLRSRHAAPYARAARVTHQRFALWVFGLCLLAFLTGAASTMWLRHDLEPAESRHALAALLMVGLMTAGWRLSKRMADPRARQWHAWLGTTALVVALGLALLGMTLLP